MGLTFVQSLDRGDGYVNPETLGRGVRPFGVSAPHWKKSCLGPHIKYIATCNQKKFHNVLSKFTILCWTEFTAILDCMWAVGCRSDTPARGRLLFVVTERLLLG